MNAEFIAEGSTVYWRNTSGNRTWIADAESGSWAEVIADALNADADVYVIE